MKLGVRLQQRLSSFSLPAEHVGAVTLVVHPNRQLHALVRDQGGVSEDVDRQPSDRG